MAGRIYSRSKEADLTKVKNETVCRGIETLCSEKGRQRRNHRAVLVESFIVAQDFGPKPLRAVPKCHAVATATLL